MSSTVEPCLASFEVDTRYYHFDQQGVVFNMWYLAYMEDARNAFFSQSGYPLEALLASGHDIQVVNVNVSWKAAIRYGDKARIEVSSVRLGTTSITLGYRIYSGDLLSALASSTYVIVDAAISGKAPLPDPMRAALAGYAED